MDPEPTVSAAPSPPFPIRVERSTPWEERALARIAGQRFLWTWLRGQPGVLARIQGSDLEATLRGHWTTAAEAIDGQRFRRARIVARVSSHLAEAETDLLRLAPMAYLQGQLPGILYAAREQLNAGDPYRLALEHRAATAEQTPLSEKDRELVVAAHHAANLAQEQAITRVRNFQTLLYIASGVLMVLVLGIGLFGILEPSKLPLCFSPGESVVCPTKTATLPRHADPAKIDAVMQATASRWDFPLVLGLGLTAAALAAAISLRGVWGTSTPFRLPIALAVLKLPTGAMTALIGLLLLRGQFVPGLSALDTSAQIVAWAVLFGYSQQLLTRLVDERGQSILNQVGHATDAQRHEGPKTHPPPKA
jgi:hypothetical protein